ncbi:MAG: hypothetical protein ACE37D_21625 [Pseudomonadales bacterium]
MPTGPENSKVAFPEHGLAVGWDDSTLAQLFEDQLLTEQRMHKANDNGQGGGDQQPGFWSHDERFTGTT